MENWFKGLSPFVVCAFLRIRPVLILYTLDFVGHMTSGQPLSDRVVHTTLARVASSKGIATVI